MTKLGGLGKNAYIDFNPHSHAGSDYRGLRKKEYPNNFNPHSHAGSDDQRRNDKGHLQHFNPHSHAGSDVTSLADTDTVPYFNPHSHAGSDGVRPPLTHRPTISIHTPTQGVTLISAVNPPSTFISIHTPTQGVTLSFVYL